MVVFRFLQAACPEWSEYPEKWREQMDTLSLLIVQGSFIDTIWDCLYTHLTLPTKA